MAKMASDTRLLERLSKEKARLAKARSTPATGVPLEPRAAVDRLRTAIRVYRQQLNTLASLDRYAAEGKVVTEHTRMRHNVKRTFKRLRLETALICAKTVLEPTSIIRRTILEAWPDSARELRVRVLEAEALLAQDTKPLDEAALADVTAQAKQMARGKIRKAWTPAEDQLIIDGARVLPGRTPEAVNTRRARLRAPARADDRRRLRHLAHAEVDEVISKNANNVHA